MPRVREAKQWVIDANSKVIGRAFVAKSDLIKTETIGTIKSGSGRFTKQEENVGDRQILRGTKMSRRFFIIARTLRAVWRS